MFRHGIISNIIPLSLCTMSARILITLAPVIQILAPCSVLSDLFSIHRRHSIILLLLLSTELCIKETVWTVQSSERALHQFRFLRKYFYDFSPGMREDTIFLKCCYFYSILSCVPLKIIEYAKLLPPFGCIVEFIDFLNMTGIVSL